jgi:hypothetical protein
MKSRKKNACEQGEQPHSHAVNDLTTRKNRQMMNRTLTQLRESPFVIERSGEKSWFESYWRVLHYAVGNQQGLARFIEQKDPPDFLLVLWAPGNATRTVLMRMLHEFRNRHHDLYVRKRFPHRADRPKFREHGTAKNEGSVARDCGVEVRRMLRSQVSKTFGQRRILVEDVRY